MELYCGQIIVNPGVPSLFIAGIPVWVGRKIHTRFKLAGKHKRNCAVLGAVTASVSYYSFVLLFAGLGWTKVRI